MTDGDGDVPRAAIQAALHAGRTTFLGLDLAVAPGALVPRPETELLARTAIEVLSAMSAARPRVVDMCCGSGNLACAIASRLPAAEVWASDLTAPCVAVARDNVARLGLGSRVHVVQGDLFAALAGQGLEGTTDAVVCNPPYISTRRLENERAELLLDEPREAFDGGPYGLSIHQKVLSAALPFLRPGGVLLFEFGLGQERQLAVLFERARGYTGFELRSDDAGRPRVALGRKRET